MSLDFGKGNRSIAFNPTSAFPLDARCYFESYAEAEAVATSAKEVGDTTTVYHYGMKLLVKEGETYTWYQISTDNTLVAENSLGNSIPTIALNSPSITLGELIIILRDNGVTANDVCLITIGTIYQIFVMISDANTISNTAKIYLWLGLANPINYSTMIGGTPLSTTVMQIITKANEQLKTNSKNLVGAINELNNKVNGGSGDSGGSFEMPIIRFSGVRSDNGTPCLTYENNLYLCVEILGGGLIQEGDLLELCAMRTCKRAVSEVRAGAKRQRLRRLFSQPISLVDNEQPKRLALTLSTVEGHYSQLFNNDRCNTFKYGCRSNVYLRIKRPFFDEAGNENNAIFSNIIKLDKSYAYLTSKLTFK